MIEVAASTVVSFGSADSTGFAVFELDDAMNGEKTSFAPGDDIFLRLHHDSTVFLEKMAATDGQLQEQGSGLRSIQQQFLWSESSDSHDLTYIPSGGLNVVYFGNEAEDLKKSGIKTAVISGGVLPAISLVSYSAAFSLFRLMAPAVELVGDEVYPLAVVAYLKEKV